MYYWWLSFHLRPIGWMLCSLRVKDGCAKDYMSSAASPVSKPIQHAYKAVSLIFDAFGFTVPLNHVTIPSAGSLRPLLHYLCRMATTYAHSAPHIPALPSEKDIQDKPWKYKGYQAFSQVIASDNDFLVIRRFGTSNARVILALQDEVSQLEEQLASFEKVYSSKDYEDINNGSFREEPKPERAAITWALKAKLKEYSPLPISYLPLVIAKRLQQLTSVDRLNR